MTVTQLQQVMILLSIDYKSTREGSPRALSCCEKPDDDPLYTVSVRNVL